MYYLLSKITRFQFSLQVSVKKFCLILFYLFPGLTDMVYPGAVHSRFEHSLGVHFLAGEAIEKIAKYQVRICQQVLTVNIFNIESLTK